MFIGEMGCWLVVGGFSLFRRYFPKDAPLLLGGYQQVADNEDGVFSDDEADGMDRSFSAQESANPAVKALIPNAEDRRPLVGLRIFMLALPACCDITGTTLMNVGLLFVAASIYQMTRGALVLFVGLFSVIFLHRKLYLFHWTALFIVVSGVAVVGLAGAIAPNPQAQPEPRSFVETGMLAIRVAADKAGAIATTPEAVQTVIGVLMIAGAQIFTATQFVLEEWILENYALEPLKVVGWEGVFGFTVTLVGMIVLHLTVGMTDAGKYGYFDMEEGWREITHNRVIAVTSVLIMISIGGFNFFGLSVTRSVSATARSTIDTCRTLFIWIVSLALGWETFKWLQILGFALLVYGTFLFNEIVQSPLRVCIRRQKRDELLPEDPIEHM
jgi:drug/metabolite transporter (DMT)-like permease